MVSLVLRHDVRPHLGPTTTFRTCIILRTYAWHPSERQGYATLRKGTRTNLRNSGQIIGFFTPIGDGVLTLFFPKISVEASKEKINPEEIAGKCSQTIILTQSTRIHGLSKHERTTSTMSKDTLARYSSSMSSASQGCMYSELEPLLTLAVSTTLLNASSGPCLDAGQKRFLSLITLRITRSIDVRIYQF